MRGDGQIEITGLGPIDTATSGQITHLSAAAYRRFLPETKASAVLLRGTDAADCSAPRSGRGAGSLPGVRPRFPVVRRLPAFARGCRRHGDRASHGETGSFRGGRCPGIRRRPRRVGRKGRNRGGCAGGRGNPHRRRLHCPPQRHAVSRHNPRRTLRHPQRCRDRRRRVRVRARRERSVGCHRPAWRGSHWATTWSWVRVPPSTAAPSPTRWCATA